MFGRLDGERVAGLVILLVSLALVAATLAGDAPGGAGGELATAAAGAVVVLYGVGVVGYLLLGDTAPATDDATVGDPDR